MKLTKMDHMAFITPDLEKTIRFYRDLLGLPLETGVGHPDFRHYFFRVGDGYIAFFAYPGAQAMEYDKFHGEPTRRPIGFDHLSLSVESKEDLFAMKDRLQAAGIPVHGAVDHGLFWSIYFFDPVNNLPLELTWSFMELIEPQAIYDVEPLPVAMEGPDPQPGHWPDVTDPTPPERMTAHMGNGHAMRPSFLAGNKARLTPAGKAAGIGD